MLELREVLTRGEDLRQVELLADDRPGACVGDDVRDLLGGVRVVDREGSGAEHHRAEIADVELGTVFEHQRDGLAASDAKLGEPPGDRVGAIAQFAPCDGELVALRADRDVVLALGDGDPERLGDGRGAQGCARGRLGLDRGGCLPDGTVHGWLLSLFLPRT